MASEVFHRHTATGDTLYFTIRATNRKMWSTSGTPDFEDLTVGNWGNYAVTMSESPASSYFYVGTFPAISGNMVAGWYAVEIFKRAGGSPAISDVMQSVFFGYWDGTTFRWWGADAISVNGTLQTAGDILGTWTGTKAGYVDAAITSRQPTIWSSESATVNLSGTTVKTLTDAPADSSGTTTLLTRIGGSLTISGGVVDANAVQVDSSATAAARMKEFFAACQSFSVDDTDFTPTTTVFECDSTDDYDRDWVYSSIWWTSGANEGTTQFVSTYSFADGKVKLTVSEMETAPSDGDTFIRIGRSR